LVPPPMAVVLCCPTGSTKGAKRAIGTDQSCFENLISGLLFF